MSHIPRNTDFNLLTIFEAVHVHKGIINAAKMLNIIPSAISQPINELQALLPDSLFICKGQGVIPAAYTTHLHQYISRGIEASFNALDTADNPHQQRVITITATPGIGTLLTPIVANALKPAFPQILLHNIATTDAARQLDQRQVDLSIDIHLHSGRATSYHVLYQDRVRVYCHAEHPALRGPQDGAHLTQYEFALLPPEGQRYPTLRRHLQGEMGERRCGFSTFNLLTQAAMIAENDVLGPTTECLLTMVSRLWPLQTLDFHSLQDEKVNVALYYNEQSGKEPLLKEIIRTIIQAFKA